MSDSVLAWSPEGQYSPVGAINMQSLGVCDVPDLECCHLRELPRQRKATDAVVWLHFLWRNGDTHGGTEILYHNSSIPVLAIWVPNLGLEIWDSQVLDFFIVKISKFGSPKFQVPILGPILQALHHVYYHHLMVGFS